MTNFLDIALPLAERGFRVFPLVPKEKRPVKMSWGDHFDAATTDRAALEMWDKENPRANVGISPDEIFCFLETDDEAALKEACKDLPPEVWDTARVSARPNRCYFIFRQTQRTRTCAIKDKSAKREGQDNLFEFKAYRTYVTGPGSIHPKTNAPYVVEWKPIPALPDILLDRLCELIGEAKPSEPQPMSDEVKRETDNLDRFLAYYDVATLGPWFNKGKSWYRPIECPWLSVHENDNQGTSTCVVFTESHGFGFNCKHRCAGKSWKEFRAELETRFADRPKFCFNEWEDSPQATIGAQTTSTPELPKDWRTRYHTFDEMTNAPPPVFIVDGFLQRDVITAIAGLVSQRKTIIAANVVHASITGEPLFDHFKVANRPARVLYLCPEMGLFSFADRIRKLGLMEHVGKTLFCRTMNSEGRLSLKDLTKDELAGALVVVDTAVRFVEGDENSSEDMKVFAEDCFRLVKDGASVVVLFHSPKGMADVSELTLENAMRGSGDLGAFVSCCWATRLQDPEQPWESESYLKNVKQRDFESDPFTVKSDKLGRLHIVTAPGSNVKLSGKKVGTKADKDGREAEALQIIRDNPKLSLPKLVAKLAEHGIDRKASWVGNKRREVFGGGVTTGEVNQPSTTP